MTRLRLPVDRKSGPLCACASLRRASRAVTQLYDEALRPARLRATQLTLLIATAMMGPVTLKHLAEATVMDRTTLTRNLRPLEKQRLLKIESGEDKRERQVHVTAVGRKAIRRALPFWEKAQSRVTRDLGEKRLRGLLATLAEVVEVAQGN